MKLKIEWSINGEAVNDFHCEEISERLAKFLADPSKEKELYEHGLLPFEGLTLWYNFKTEGATLVTSSHVLVDNLRALVKEGRIQAELWFVDGSGEVDMGLGKDGRCKVWPSRTQISVTPLDRILF